MEIEANNIRNISKDPVRIKTILRIAAVTLFVIASVIMTAYRLKFLSDIKQAKINEMESMIESYSSDMSEVIRMSDEFMDSLLVCIRTDKLSPVDAYFLAKTADSTSAWRVWQGDDSDVRAGNELYINNRGRLVITRRMQNDNVRKVFSEAEKAKPPFPADVFIYDKTNGTGIHVSKDTGVLFEDSTMCSAASAQVEGKAHLNGECVYYFSHPVEGTDFVVEICVRYKDLMSGGAVSFTLIRMFIITGLLIAITSVSLFIISGYVGMTGLALAEKYRAQEADRAKTSFLAGMSHEIRTPLNSILGLNELILKEQINSTVKGYALDIQSAGKMLLSLINDILDYARINVGIEIKNSPYEVKEIMQELYSIFHPLAMIKELELDFKMDPRIPVSLNGDFQRIIQACQNLLSNAVKYTDRGRILFFMGFEPDGDNVILIIMCKDTGRGIRTESLPYVFERFSRADMDKNRTIEGTGLGLAIVKEIAEAMGGTVSVESEYGSGSEFTMKIPQKIHLNYPSGEFIPNTYDDKTEDTVISAPGLKVLVVDDTHMNLKVMRKFLELMDIDADTASSGDECLDMVTDNHYNIIFLDDRMPDKDGMEVMEELKDKISDTKVVMVTANVVSGSKEKYLSAGFDDYLPKPVSFESLSDTIKKLMPGEYIHMKVLDNNVDDTGFSIPPGFDMNEGIRLCGDEQTYKEIVTEFMQNADAAIYDLNRYRQAMDEEAFTRVAHSLKSSSALAGCSKLKNMAADVEQMGFSSGERLPDLIAELKTVSEFYSQHRKDNKQDGEDINEEAAEDIFGHLWSYVSDFNDEAVSSMVQSISRYNFPGKYAEYFTEIKKAQSNMDWERLFKIFKEMGYE